MSIEAKLRRLQKEVEELKRQNSGTREASYVDELTGGGARQFPDATIGVESPESVITSRNRPEPQTSESATPQAASRETTGGGTQVENFQTT